MATKSTNPFSTVQIHPLVGGLDTRSRPADLPAGAFRFKLNAQVTRDGKLCRRGGHSAFSGAATGTTNYDLRHQGGTREIPNFAFYEVTGSGKSLLFAGTQDTIWVLNETTGLWTQLITGAGMPGYRWRAASLQDKVVFASGAHAPVYYDCDTPPPGAMPTLPIGVTVPGGMTGIVAGRTVAGAGVVVSYQGFILIMNLTDNTGQRYPTKIAWCDLNNPLMWDAIDNTVTPPMNTVANFQDLNYGDEILAAAALLGSLYIFTRQSIWKMNVADLTSGPSVFSFAQIYTEPQQQTGCLVYPFSLVSDGIDLYWMSREAIYRYNPYLLAPEAEPWLYNAVGLIYKKFDTIINAGSCNDPTAVWNPTSRELWWSWPGGPNNPATNNFTLVAQLDQKTADLVDYGYGFLCNYRRTPNDITCDEDQVLLGSSYLDWAIKDIGTMFARQDYNLAGAALTVDIPMSANPALYPYDSVLRGMIPAAPTDRDKVVRLTHLEIDVTPEANPCNLNVRLGNSYSLQDPSEGQSNTTGAPITGAGSNFCAVMWGTRVSKPCACADDFTMDQMKAKNFKPSNANDYPVFQRGRYCYYEVSVTQPVPSASNPSSGDVCFEQISFQVSVMPS